MHLPQPSSRDLARAESRARDVEARFGLSARIDSEVPTTWHLRGTHEARALEVSLGSPRMRRWGKRAVQDWLHLTLHEPTWLPVGAELRPAARSYWDWREGLPGERPHLRVQHQQLGMLEYMLLPSTLHAELLERAASTLRSLPGEATWLSAGHDEWQIRVSNLDETAPEQVLERVLAWRGLELLDCAT